MEALNAGQNYFELFELPVDFIVDEQQLAQRYRQLQSAVHPDKYALASDQERRLAVQHSTRINQAFQTLKQPLPRALYLLQLNGVDVSNESSVAMCGDFLMEQMQLREQLEAVPNSADPMHALNELEMQLKSAISHLLDEIASLFKRGEEIDLEQTKDRVYRLQFFDKLQAELLQLEEKLY